MKLSLKNFGLMVLLSTSFLSRGQINDFNNEWTSIGPNVTPNNPNFRSDGGVGPVEFIRVSDRQEGLLLAGSLNGGLFHSIDGGENWTNSGSDDWAYSGCAWADFYPTDHNVWFACANFSDANGKPGPVGQEGGVLRSMDQGKSWDLIGDYQELMGSEYLIIYGTRFHPINPKLMYVLTSEGLIYTENCLESSVKWQKSYNITGLVYDLDFMDGKMYVAQISNGKWSIFSCEENSITRFKKLAFIEDEGKEMRNLTFEPANGELLVVKDFSKESDEIIRYNPSTDATSIVLKGLKISFGSGHSFAVSPYHNGEFYIGNNTDVKKWAPPYNKTIEIGGKHHVDIEFIAYDPKDSLKVYLCTHGGVYISSNVGKDWIPKMNGFGNCEVMGMSVSTIDPRQVVIGSYHDGSMVYADHEKSGIFDWRTVNGGDGLIPLIDPNNNAVVYTSNQFTGGGLFYSDDTARKVKINIHNINNLKTPGWEMSAVLDHFNTNTVFFNFIETSEVNLNNINICRTKDAKARQSAEVISNFRKSHKLDSYKVFGLYNSKYQENVLIAYVLDYVKNEAGELIVMHRLFRTDQANGPANEVIDSWYEIKHANNEWIGDVEIDGKNPNIIYLSYAIGKKNPDTIFGDKGMVYAIEYRENKRHSIRRIYDISKNIPNSVAGRFNLYYTKDSGGALIVATRTGVYFGNMQVSNGKFKWIKIGATLPHCKVYGLDYNSEKRIITVGYFGRGVWQYQVDDSIQ